MTVERDNDENRSLSADCGLSAAATQPLASEAPPNSTALQQQDKPEPQRDDPERYTLIPEPRQDQITSQPDETWNGFEDAFWNLGQVMLWIATKNSELVSDASDASGTLGKSVGSSESYGLAAGSIMIQENLTPQQSCDAARKIKQLCMVGTLNATTRSKSISPDEWTHLEIIVRETY